MDKLTSCLILLSATALAACATQVPATSTATDTGHETVAAAVPPTASATAPRLVATPPKDAARPKGEVVVQGYTQVMVDGQQRYCRDDLATGSHTARIPVCLTKAQLLAEQARAQQFIEEIQRATPASGGGYMQGGMMAY
jgi:hypothetical protein